MSPGARIGRGLGAVLAWTVLGLAAALGLALASPVILLALLAKTGVLLWQLFGRRGETAGVPDEATPELARRIDGVDYQLPCGCPQASALTGRCPDCGWLSCLEHQGATHLCDPSDPISAWQNAPTPLYDQASDPDWPVDLPLRRHPDGSVDVDGLVDEIYLHLEQQR